MILGIQGTRKFDDYNILLRAMHTGLSDIPDDDDLVLIYTAGPANINSLVTEFVNVSERGFKARGKKIRMIRLSPKMIEDKVLELDYFIFLCKPGERTPEIIEIAEENDIDVGIYRY